MVIAVTTIIALALMISGMVLKNAWLLLVAVISWIIFAFVAVEYTFTNTAISNGLLTLGGVMAIVCAVMTLTTWMSMRPGKMTNEDGQENYKRKVLAITRRKPKYPY